MHRAGFKMLTVDIDEIEVSYSSMFKLMFELQAMAESSAAWRRSKHLNRDVLLAASAIYKVPTFPRMFLLFYNTSKLLLF